MKAYYSFKVANQMLDSDIVVKGYVQSAIKKQIYKYIEHNAVRNIEIQHGFDGDDFIKNRTTILVSFDYYKLPRIIKNLRK